MSPTFMIIPSMACQAGCSYCFGPHKGAVMDERTAREAASFVHRIAVECGMSEISVIFHGGEPLLAPLPVWETLLACLCRTPGNIPISLNVQSNLWNLDDSFLALFAKYRVSVGTSLDGPEEICDRNRGSGYYERTMAGIERSELPGIRPGAIATLTKQSLPHAKEILAFFRDRGINPVLHAAVKGMGQEEDTFSLDAGEYADAVIHLYPWYVKNRKFFSVPTLDHFVSAVVHGDPHVCTLQDCLGMFLAVSPTGDITSCQRLSGRKEYTLGNIFDQPDIGTLMKSGAWQRLEERQRLVSDRCGSCRWEDICRGGCYYNAATTGDGVIDPLCEAYRRIYDFLYDQVSAEISLEENVAAIRRRPPRKDEHPFLRSGPYISLADRVHPSEVAENARQVLGAYALGRFRDPEEAARYMTDAHFSADAESTLAALAAMKENLERKRINLNNCYIHTTFRCNLRCTHCYADAGDRAEEMPVQEMARLAEEALSLRFRQLIITGGEPLFHRDRAGLAALCRSLRGRGSNIVLRTNLTGSFTDEELEEIASSFDQVVVSIDGNEETHDRRRGRACGNSGTGWRYPASASARCFLWGVRRCRRNRLSASASTSMSRSRIFCALPSGRCSPAGSGRISISVRTERPIPAMRGRPRSPSLAMSLRRDSGQCSRRRSSCGSGAAQLIQLISAGNVISGISAAVRAAPGETGRRQTRIPRRRNAGM